MSVPEPRTAQEIASTALSLWDMHAEDSGDERSLAFTVTKDLMEFGLSKEDAATAAVFAKTALATAGDSSGIPQELLSHPVFQPMLAELQSGEWGLE